MRNWMRERMKRRKKKPENETEATGKVGQQKPLVDESHPQPLMPAYDDVEPEATSAPEVAQEPPAINEPRMETEVQPESPSMPPPGVPEHRPAQPAGKTSGRPSKGVVVLAIGLPGSGKTTWFKRRGVTPLSSDMLRSILFDDITEQRDRQKNGDDKSQGYSPKLLRRVRINRDRQDIQDKNCGFQILNLKTESP